MIVVFGSINVDLIFEVTALPQAGQTLQALESSLEPGGKGANQACAAALDGARVVMAGAVGRDAMADTALGTMRAAGVDLSRITVVDGVTGCASICTDATGANQIVVAGGANLGARADTVEDDLLGPGTVVLTQMEVDPAETAGLIRRARHAGARIVHNHAPALPLDMRVLSLVDVVVVNEDEAEFLAVECGAGPVSAHSLADRLGTTVVCTLGAGGVAWAGPIGEGHVAAWVVDVIDTTAAGDCFTGVLAASLDRGSTLAQAVARANVAASLACTRSGSQRSLPTRIETSQAELTR